MSSESRVVVVKLGPVEKHGDADTLGVTMVHGEGFLVGKGKHSKEKRP